MLRGAGAFKEKRTGEVAGASGWEQWEGVAAGSEAAHAHDCAARGCCEAHHEVVSDVVDVVAHEVGIHPDEVDL